jgi:hypothetical protein
MARARASDDEDAGAAPASRSKRTTGRRKSSKLQALQVGKANDPSSLINLDNPEATIAAYCGVNDVGRFQRFYTSPLVIPHYLNSLAYRGHHRRTVLSLLADLPHDVYWASDEDPAKVYPLDQESTRKTNLTYRIGLILWQFLRSLRKGLLANTPAIDCAKYTKLTKCKLPIPSTPLSSAEVPSFGSFPRECEMEALNRCLCLFAHMKYTTNKSQWDKRFFGKLVWDESVMITTEYQPD